MKNQLPKIKHDGIRELIEALTLQYQDFCARSTNVGQTMDFNLRDYAHYTLLCREFGGHAKLIVTIMQILRNHYRITIPAPDGNGCIEVMHHSHVQKSQSREGQLDRSMVSQVMATV